MHWTFFYFYHYLLYFCWVDAIYLTCLVFLKSPWWLVWIFCAPMPLILKNKITKIDHKKIFCGPSKIISGLINTCLKYFMSPTKIICPPTYLMYGPLLTLLSFRSSCRPLDKLPSNSNFWNLQSNNVSSTSSVWPKHSNIPLCKRFFMLLSCCLYPNSDEEILPSRLALTIAINILDSVLSSNLPFNLEPKPPLINKTNQPINLQHIFFILAKTLFRFYFQDCFAKFVVAYWV